MAIVLDGVGTVNGVTLPTTGFGKVLQVVRATDTTLRSTTSTSFVDVTGMSVTITPQKSTSAVLLISSVRALAPNNSYIEIQITDSSNNAISGANSHAFGVNATIPVSVMTVIAYATPATTSATTYKLRFRSFNGSTAEIQNANATGQMYAIEVSA